MKPLEELNEDHKEKGLHKPAVQRIVRLGAGTSTAHV